SEGFAGPPGHSARESALTREQLAEASLPRHFLICPPRASYRPGTWRAEGGWSALSRYTPLHLAGGARVVRRIALDGLARGGPGEGLFASVFAMTALEQFLLEHPRQG